ncbi:MFS transporter, partial [Staphylococcus aureus]
GTVSGWMNLWGNIGALISPLLAGIVVDQLGWSMTLQLLIVPAVIAAILWFFVKPDQPLVVDEEQSN